MSGAAGVRADGRFAGHFNGRTAAITGAASGMGRALAVALANAGAHLALADVHEAPLRETAALARAAGRPDTRISLHRTDVADDTAVQAFAAAAALAHPAIHLVFNNAGVSVTDTAEQMARDDFEWLMGINFWGVVNGTRAFLPLIRAAGGGHVVNTASIFGVVAFATQSAYNASKFAVRGYTEALRQELAGSGVQVHCVLPGGVRTGIVRASRYHPRDNRQPTRDELAARFEAMAGLSAGEAARIILDGVRRGRGRILVGRDARVLDWLARLAPARYADVAAWLARRAGIGGPADGAP